MRIDVEAGSASIQSLASGTTDRSQLQALLKYCRTNKGKIHFVVYSLTRFAREKFDHFARSAPT